MLAFAIPKTVGKAVIRNKIRRQLREEFVKIVSEKNKTISQGNYLIKVHSAEINNSVTRILLETAIDDLKNKNER